MLSLYFYYKIKNRMSESEFSLFLVCLFLLSFTIPSFKYCTNTLFHCCLYPLALRWYNHISRLLLSLFTSVVTLNTLASVWIWWDVCPSISVAAMLFFLYPPGRTVLLAVGMTCVLGFSTSWVSLPGFGNHQEINPSVLRSRTLLSIDYAAVKVSN